MATSSWLRIAVVQFAPKIGEVHANIAKVCDLCRGLTPRSVDLVCFPEMIFTGYVFPDALSIKPYLEHPKTGLTASFCAELARRLEYFVVAGYPERLESPSPSPSMPITSILTSDPDMLIGANAAAVYDATGHLVHTYHKSNLFPTDRTWARPGPGFTAVDLPLPFGRSAVAICNDLNVDVRAGGGWESIERGPYELAWWCQREGVRVLVLLNAWLKPEDGGWRDGLEPNWEVLNYWAMRLRPLWAKPSKGGDEEPDVPRQMDVAAHANDEREVIVVVCNRCGNERGKTFAGSSAMFSMRRTRIVTCHEQEQGVCVWTTGIGSQTLSSS
ncbi:carbon-nitrogen hydrolase [Boletus coccyginus]|nr:carbon-nitrogen hydrolase [Boletus coccyginus]